MQKMDEAIRPEGTHQGKGRGVGKPGQRRHMEIEHFKAVQEPKAGVGDT